MSELPRCLIIVCPQFLASILLLRVNVAHIRSYTTDDSSAQCRFLSQQASLTSSKLEVVVFLQYISFDPPGSCACLDPCECVQHFEITFQGPIYAKEENQFSKTKDFREKFVLPSFVPSDLGLNLVVIILSLSRVCLLMLSCFALCLCWPQKLDKAKTCSIHSVNLNT